MRSQINYISTSKREDLGTSLDTISDTITLQIEIEKRYTFILKNDSSYKIKKRLNELFSLVHTYENTMSIHRFVLLQHFTRLKVKLRT